MISREHPSLGKERPFFTIAGAGAYRRDLTNAEVYQLNGGHFALEENAAAIAAHIRRFLSREGH